MKGMMKEKILKFELQNHLTEKIIPFWQSLKDEEFGGYYGYMDFDCKVDKTAAKGCILNSRILWFFSACYNVIKDEKCIEFASHAYEFLKKSFWDDEFGGLYWMVDHKGNVIDSTKHVYVQAFGIYGLSEYYRATKNDQALEYAQKLFELLEKTCKKENGYTEQFNRNWTPKENRFLSENGVIASKTMNTHLHVLEAYTNLYRVYKNEDVYNSLEWIVKLFVEKVYDKATDHFKVFCDEAWENLIDAISYGHDIEASWLLCEASEYLNDRKLKEKAEQIALKVAEVTFNQAFDGKGLINEKVNGRIDRSKIWWVQAEAVVGFYNAYQKSGNPEYLDAAYDTWEFIKDHIVDKRGGSEWYWKVNEDLTVPAMLIVEPWKCPYHNGRMCLEIIKRV